MSSKGCYTTFVSCDTYYDMIYLPYTDKHTDGFFSDPLEIITGVAGVNNQRLVLQENSTINR